MPVLPVLLWLLFFTLPRMWGGEGEGVEGEGVEGEGVEGGGVEGGGVEKETVEGGVKEDQE